MLSVFPTFFYKQVFDNNYVNYIIISSDKNKLHCWLSSLSLEII